MSASTFEGYGATSVVPDERRAAAALRWKQRYFTFHFARHLPDDRGAAIADVGCGFGPYLHAMRELGYRNLRGVDLGPEQVAHARDVLGFGDAVEQGDGIEWLERHEGELDCVLAFDILEHLALDDLLRMGRALHAALKPGGRVIVHVPNGMAPLNPIVPGDITHRRAFTTQSLTQLFAYAGLEPVEFIELAPFPHSLRSRVQRALWLGLIAPAIRLFVLVAHGRVEGRIHTLNVAAVAVRR